MIDEEKALLSWKVRAKTMVFRIWFLTKDQKLNFTTASFIRGFDEGEIIGRMKEISKQECFDKWLTPTSVEFKKECI